jgi:class 3 adenylate cyclase
MAQNPSERRLAAIMFTDIVGSTAVTARSESAGLALRDRHRDLVRAHVERYHGRFIEAPGDESLSTFESAVDAVQCALAIHEEVDADPELELHVGIHLGETVFRGSEVFGDGVNIAARICALSEGAGICISGEVHQAVRNQPGIEARSLGDHALKNVGRAVSVFAIAAPGSSPAAPMRRGLRNLPRAVQVLLAVLAIAIGLSATGYVLRRPLARLAVLALMRVATPPYEQQIAFATTSDGVKIAYATVGQGPPVVIVPGWVSHIEHGINSPIFDPLTPRLRGRHQVVRYDQRGTGVSDRHAEDLTLEGRVRDLEAVVDAIGACSARRRVGPRPLSTRRAIPNGSRDSPSWVRSRAAARRSVRRRPCLPRQRGAAGARTTALFASSSRSTCVPRPMRSSFRG